MFTRLLTCAVRKIKHMQLPRQGPVRSVESPAHSANRTTLSVSPQLFILHRGFTRKSNSRKEIHEEVRAVKAPDNINGAKEEAKANELKMPLFVEREINWIEEPGKAPRKLPFRVTYKGTAGYNAVTTGTWTIENKVRLAPFFNREDVLLEMLEAQYHNMNLGSQKPRYSIQMMSPGSGKTRVLAEWIMQAFANSNVIGNFLKKDTKISARKSFLNALYWSAYKQHTIISRGSTWEFRALTEASMATVTIKVIRDTILLCHRGQSINYHGQLIHITESSARRYFGLEKEIDVFIGLFISLADITYESPASLPFEEAGLPPTKSFVFFSIDECQLMSRKFPRENKEDAVYLLFREIAAPSSALLHQGVVPFWFAVGTNLPGRFFNLEGQQYFTIIISSLSNLLNIKYLAHICVEFFAFKLPEKYYKSNFDLPEMPEKAAKAIIHNYLKTFGNPRAVEIFVQKAIELINKHVQGHGSADKVARANDLDRELGQELDSQFPDMTVTGLAEDIERLEIAAALCSEMDYDKHIPGLNVSPKQLSTNGYLTIWKREAVDLVNSGLVKFYMTRPFFKLSTEKLLLELATLKCNKSANSQHWEPEIISLSSLVLQKDCADYLLPSNNLKGKKFEIAVASTLYARYKLSQTEHVLLKDIFPAKHLPADLLEATVKLNGVVRLKKQVSEKSSDAFAAIQKNQVIAIDIGNSKFADVMVPISIKGQTTILALQCKQYAGKPFLSALVANCLTVIERGYYFVAINPVQHQITEFQDRLKEATNQNTDLVLARSFLAESQELLSPLYMVGMNFVPHEFMETS